MNFAVYQTALVIVLVLNLFFWIFAICFRVFFQCSYDDNGFRVRSRTGRRRRNRRSSVIRRSPAGARNPAFTDQESLPPYSIATALEAPPPYEDAVKLPIARISSSRHDIQINTFPRMNCRTRPRIYEQTVTLMVPVEPTSRSESELLLSLNELPPSIINECSTESFPTSDNFQFESFAGVTGCAEEQSDEDIPFTFVIDGIGQQSATLLGMTNTTTTLTDGIDLQTHSKA